MKAIRILCLLFCFQMFSVFAQVLPGAYQTSAYVNTLKNKRIAVVVNHTATIGNTHLVDSLLSLGVKITTIFAPEHGFRGDADAGAHVKSGIDPKTQIPIVSLYGKNKKPSAEQLQNIDLVVFDIQDVGCRFYTFISTLTYVMEACAEQGKELLILDRPNPNGHYIDGPVLEMPHSSFVGMHQVPIVYGMTIAEYGKMVNEEGWLSKGVRCELLIVQCANYTHSTPYELPIAPSPNLPNMRAIYLYPTLCLFEGTPISSGRGTAQQFQIWGGPDIDPEKIDQDTSFIPVPMPGAEKPLNLDKLCFGRSYRMQSPSDLFNQKAIQVSVLKDAYSSSKNQTQFFKSFFLKLAGTSQLQNDIISGKSESEIRASWQPKIDKFRTIRSRYLLYAE